jgi:hypothetical protein
MSAEADMPRSPMDQKRIADLERELATSHEERKAMFERMGADLANAKAALRRIAFWIPTISYEGNERRFTDVEEVFTLKRIAADWSRK